jgi:hypothetical protein
MEIAAAYLVNLAEAVVGEVGHVIQTGDEVAASATRVAVIEIAADADVGLLGEMSL